MDLNTRDCARITHALQWLQDNARRQPSLEELAAECGLSPFHLQRLFKKWAGISPKRFLQVLTVAHARVLLRHSQPILDASFATGLSGPGRLHDLFVQVEAMTPGEYKELGRGLEIAWGCFESPWGPCLMATTERGICALEFLSTGLGPSSAVEQQEAVDALRKHWPRAEFDPRMDIRRF